MKGSIYKILGVVVIILMVYTLIEHVVNFFVDRSVLEKNYRYTLTEEISVGSYSKGSGTNSKYTFRVNGKLYTDFTYLPLRRNGSRYFVKFYPENPNRNNPTIIMADSMDVANLPADGFKELPHR